MFVGGAEDNGWLAKNVLEFLGWLTTVDREDLETEPNIMFIIFSVVVICDGER